MKVKQEYIVCDVCEKKVFGTEWTEITFDRDKMSYKFDTCYKCLRGKIAIRKVYKKIINLISKEKTKGNSWEAILIINYGVVITALVYLWMRRY